MIWFLLQKIGFYVFLFLTVYYVYKKRYEALLILYFFGKTFATCYQFAYTIWFPTKVIAMGMLVCLLFEKKKRRSMAARYINPLAVTLVSMIILSDIIGLIYPGEYASHISSIRRMVNSSYSYLTPVVVLFFGLILKRGFVKRLLPAYCLAVEVAIAFGLIHYVCLSLGIEFMPILRQDGTVNMGAFAPMGGEAVPRVYGVSGEPKNLGFMICPYLFVSLIMWRQGNYRLNKKAYHVLALIAGTFVLINTYSSSALINFFLVIPVFLVLVPMPNISYKAGLAVSVLCLIGCLWALKNELNQYQSPFKEDTFMSLMYERTFGRAQNEMENDRQESVVMEHFAAKAEPIHILFGWGTSQYTFHMPGQTAGSALIPMQSGLVLTLVDFGLAGIILLVSIFCLVVTILRKSERSKNVYALAFSIAALSAYVGALMFGTIVSSFMYLMLAIYAYCDDQEERKLKRPLLAVRNEEESEKAVV